MPLYVAEFANIGLDSNNKLINAVPMPPLAEQTVAIGAASVQSTVFGLNTFMIRVHTDVVCSILVGTNPTATATRARMAAGQTEYFSVQPGTRIAVITNV